MGRVLGQILLAGGHVEEEGDLEVIELGPQEEEEAGISEESEEDGPGLPLQNVSFFLFFLCFSFCSTFLWG